MGFWDIFKGFKDSAETKVTGYVVNQVAKYVNTLLAENLDEWIRASLISVGQVLKQAGGASAGFPAEKITCDFLGKKQSKGIIKLLNLHYKLSRGIFGEYPDFVEKCRNKLNNSLENYIKYFDQLKTARSSKELCKFKSGLEKYLIVIRGICEKSDYQNNTVDKIIELSKEDIKEKKKEFETGTLGDFIGTVFIPLLNSSLENLRNNEHEKCAIYIGEKEPTGFKLDFNKLGLSTQKDEFNNGSLITTYEEKNINDRIITGNEKYLKKLKSDSEKIYKEAEKIEKEINKNHLKIENKINNNVLEDGKKRYGFDNLYKEHEYAKQIISNELEKLEDLKYHVSKENNVALASDLYKEIKNSFSLIVGNYERSLLIYNKILDYVKKFVPYISEINKWKRDIEKWIEIISSSNLFSDEVIKGVVNAHLEYFNSFYCNEVDEKTNFVKELERAKPAYNFISELYKIASNEKTFNEYYNEICKLGFENYGKLIKNNFNKSIEKILSRGIDKNTTIKADNELKKLKESLSLAKQCDKAYKDLESLEGKIENKSEISTFLKLNPKEINTEKINVSDPNNLMISKINTVESKISGIKSEMLTTTQRITLKASSLKDKIKSKLGMDSKNKGG